MSFYFFKLSIYINSNNNNIYNFNKFDKYISEINDKY